MADIIGPSAGRLRATVENHPELNDLIRNGDVDSAYMTELLDQLNQLRSVSNTVHQQGYQPSKSDVTDLLNAMAGSEAAVSAIDNNIDQLGAGTVSAANIVQGVKKWVTGKLVPWITSLWQSVWAVIQRLTTPKEWKISGQLGTSVLGLAQASIEITFE
jgi:hypothetical protein